MSGQHPPLEHRYTDLLCHYQIKAALKGTAPPFNATALAGVLKRVDNKTRRHRSLEQAVQAHFLALYFDQNPGKTYRGDVLAITKDGEALVQIVDLGVEATAHTSGPVWPGRTAMWLPDVNKTTGVLTWSQAD